MGQATEQVSQRNLPSGASKIKGTAKQRWRPTFVQVVLGVPILYMTLIYLIPVGSVLLKSVAEPDLGFTHYVRALTDPVILQVLWITLKIAFIVSIAAVLLGYPVAYLISRQPPQRARILTMLVIIPFWTSVLVRSFAWIVILGDQGLVANLLQPFTGSTEGILYSQTAVILAMTQVLLPYAILVLKGAMDQIDITLVAAARSLGANPFFAYLRVYFPLTLPAVFSSGMLVFVISLGFYITPALVGGPRESTIAILIERNISVLFDWPMAATLSTILLIVTVVIYVTVQKLTRVRTVVTL